MSGFPYHPYDHDVVVQLQADQITLRTERVNFEDLDHNTTTSKAAGDAPGDEKEKGS